jgi:hypothetical protein
VTYNQITTKIPQSTTNLQNVPIAVIWLVYHHERAFTTHQRVHRPALNCVLAVGRHPWEERLVVVRHPSEQWLIVLRDPDQSRA